MTEKKTTCKAKYTNHFRIGTNAIEFIVDFGQFYQGDNEPCYHTRIITCPSYIKEFRKILEDSIRDYEQSHGQIDD